MRVLFCDVMSQAAMVTNISWSLGWPFRRESEPADIRTAVSALPSSTDTHVAPENASDSDWELVPPDLFSESDSENQNENPGENPTARKTARPMVKAGGFLLKVEIAVFFSFDSFGLRFIWRDFRDLLNEFWLLSIHFHFRFWTFWRQRGRIS